MKKIITGFLITAAALSIIAAPITFARSIFSDVNENTTYPDAINWAYDQGIIRGYGDGTFGPDNCVRRAELVKMILEYIYPGQAMQNLTADEPNFSDVFASDWHYLYIKLAKSKGIISGYADGTFRPNICVNRAEAMKIAVGSLFPNQQLSYNNSPVYLDNKIVSDIPATGWYVPYAKFLFTNHLLGIVHAVLETDSANYEYLKYFPAGDMSRKEVAQMLKLISDFQAGTSSGGTTGGTTQATTPGTLGTPALLTPANNTVFTDSSLTVGFTWSAATNASYYELMIRVPDSVNYFVTQRADDTSSSYRFNIANGSTQGYMWKVRAYADNGEIRESGENYLQFTPPPSITLTGPANEAQYYHGLVIPFQWTNSNLTPGGEFTVIMSCANNSYPTSDRWLEWSAGNNTVTSYNLNTATDFNPSNTIGYGFNFDSNLYCHWRIQYLPQDSAAAIIRSETRNLIIKIDTI